MLGGYSCTNSQLGEGSLSANHALGKRGSGEFRPAGTTTWSERIKSREKKEVVTRNHKPKKGRFPRAKVDIGADNWKPTHCPPECPCHCPLFAG